MEHDIDIDSVTLPIPPNALGYFSSAIVQLVSHKRGTYVKIPPGYILLGMFGWRVYAKVNPLQKAAICDYISSNDPVVVHSPENDKFSVGCIPVGMQCFIAALNSANVTEVLLAGYGFKCPKSTMSFLNNLERLSNSSCVPVYDVGRNYAEMSRPPIPLFSMPRPGKTYGMLLGRSGSVEYYITHWPQPGVKVRVIVYPRVVHLAKTFLGSTYKKIPTTIGGLRKRLESVREKFNELKNVSPARFVGYRVEVTVIGNLSLDEACTIAEPFIPRPGVLPGSVTMSDQVSLEQYIGIVEQAIQIANNVCRGRSGRHCTRDQSRAMTRVYNALGLVSRIILINMYLSTRTPIRTTVAQVDPRPMIDRAPVSPVTIGPPGSLSHLEEVVRADKLLKWTTNPRLRDADKRDWVCVRRRCGGRCTKSFPCKLGLAYWAVETYGSNWPLHLQSYPSTPPQAQSPASAVSHTLTPQSSPCEQLSPISDCELSSPPVFSPNQSPSVSPPPAFSPNPSGNLSVSQQLELEINRAEALLVTRVAPKCSHFLCGIRRNGAITKTFATKRGLAEWAVETYGTIDWSSHLLCRSPSSVASSPGGRNDRLVHTVMRMRLISEESRKIVYSCPRPQNGGTEGDLNY